MNQDLSPDRIIPGRAQCISVIIPTYNRAALLVDALDSVLAQGGLPAGTELEIIVIDDGSTDDTSDRVRAYLPRVTYVRQTNGGVASARNHGIRLSKGELICFLDSDDVWLPTKLAAQLAVMQAFPEAGLVATEISPFGGAGADQTRSKAALYRIYEGWVVERLLFGNWIQTSTVIVRRDALKRAGCFDEDVGQFGEDWLLWMRIASAHQVRFVAEPLVRYRLHSQSLTSHQPESQFASLMSILDRIELLPQFVRKPWLVARARYRVCVLRALRDLHADQFDRAIAKLRRACSLRPLPFRALALLGLARARLSFIHTAGAQP